METGFLNPIQDEEHFPSNFYNQTNILDNSEHMLFGEMIIPEVVDEVIDYDDLWQTVDDTATSSHADDSQTSKEDFQKIVSEWQHQLTFMQESEVIRQILPVEEKIEVSDMFSIQSSNVDTDPCIDELFPLESKPSNTDDNTKEIKTLVILDNGKPLTTAKQIIKTENPDFKMNTDSGVANVDKKIHHVVKNSEISQSSTIVHQTFRNTSKIIENLVPIIKQELFQPLDANDLVTENEFAKDINSGVVNTPQLFREQVIAASDNLKSKEVKQEPIVNLVSIKCEREEPLVDVETVTDNLPLLMAQDLNSLLEQFEATEKVNAVQPVTPTLPLSPSQARTPNQTIRDALPTEVINRIKASRENHKKKISLIPAMPSKKLGKTATRMQDAGVTLSRNKLLKLVTGGSGGETVVVRLDHDYCSGNNETDVSGNGVNSNSCKSNAFYVTDNSEYPSQSSTPEARPLDYYKSRERSRTDNNSRKDSGLESGENSEEDTPTMMTSKVVIKSGSGLKSVNVVTEKGFVLGSQYTPIAKNVPMVSVLKKNISVKVENAKETKSSAVQATNNECSSISVLEENVEIPRKKKRKLNLEEYRVRREEREKTCSQESSRASSPVPSEITADRPGEDISRGMSMEKPRMHNVEVQTQTFDFMDSTSESTKDKKKHKTSDKERRNDLKQRSYRSRDTRSSSSSSVNSEHRRSHRRKSSPRRKRQHKNSVSRMWSRSPSSSSSSHSPDSKSRVRSRSGERRRRRRRSSSSGSRHRPRFQRRDSRNRDRSWQRQRSRSPFRSREPRQEGFNGQEKVRQVEERRVIYVGRIEEGTTKADLRRRFQQFGDIVDISVHFRERGDNYGFVTFAYQADAYQAVEHGNDNPKLPHYDLCFGGRRAFCKQRYADLDGIASVRSQYGDPHPLSQPRLDDSFDFLLHEVKSKLLKRPTV